MTNESIIFFDRKAPAFLIAALIFLSLVSISIDTLPNLSENTLTYIRYFDYFTVTIFTIEYLSRIYYAQNRKKYILSFYGIIDLLAILPFYFSFFIDLRALRILRVIRFIRVFKIVRYSAAVSRMTKALIDAKEELIISIIMLCVMVYLTAYGIYIFEHDAQPDKFTTIFDAMWWSIVTITTVGYGDIYPITIGGRIFTFFMMIIGLGLVAIPTGIFATALFKVKSVDSK